MMCLNIEVFANLFCKKRTKGSAVPILHEPWGHAVWDMHCHILPGVDDGAENMQTALKMIEKEIEEGVTDIVLTPHYIDGRTDLWFVEKRYQSLVCAVKEKGYPINLYLGSEIFYNADSINALNENEILTLAGSLYVLVEFDIDINYWKMQNAFQELQAAGYHPVLAHFERYLELENREERVEELVQQGVLMQANSNSFLREETSSFLLALVEKDLIHFIGTDSHSIDWRPPQMKRTLSCLRKNLRHETVLRIVSENGNIITQEK